jgi:hypothetical protein
MLYAQGLACTVVRSSPDDNTSLGETAIGIFIGTAPTWVYDRPDFATGLGD